MRLYADGVSVEAGLSRAGSSRAGLSRAGLSRAGLSRAGLSRAVVTLACGAGLLLLLQPSTSGGALAFVAVALLAALTLRRLGVRLPAATPARLAAAERRAEYRGAPRLRDPDARGRSRPRAPTGRPADTRA